jgi:DNA repair photolyase
VLLRLPLEIKDLFREWLEANRPDAAKHVMSLIRQMRGGKDYDAEWHTRQRGVGPYAQMLAHRFHMAVKRLGLKDGTQLRTDLFQRPPKPGDQLALF